MPIVSPLPRQVEHDRLDRLSVLGEERSWMRLTERRRHPLRLRLRAGRDHEIYLYFQVVGADRHLEAVGLSPGLCDDSCDGRLGKAEEPQDPCAGLFARAKSARSSGRSSAVRQIRCSSPGGPGSAIARAEPVWSKTPGAVPASPSEIPPFGSVACLRTPASNSS